MLNVADVVERESVGGEIGFAVSLVHGGAKGSLRGAAALRSQNATLHAIIFIYATYFLVDTNKVIL